MGTIADLIASTKAALASGVGAIMVLRKYGTAETSNEIVSALEGASGGLLSHATGARTSATATGAIVLDEPYDPPLRIVYAVGAGTLMVRLASDTTATFPIVVTANERVTEFEITAVLTAGTTCAGAIYGAR